MNVSSFLNAAAPSQWSTFSRLFNSSVASWSGVILATTATTLVGLGLYRWSHSTPTQAAPDRSFQEIKERVSKVYNYVLGGFVLTAAAAVVTHVSRLSLKIFNKPYLAFAMTLTSAGALVATLMIDKDNSKAKHVAWSIFNITMGMTLTPLGYLNQRILAQAAAISLGLGAALTLVAFRAPDRRFLEWEGPLMAALTTISLASCVAYFFPRSAFAYGVDRASLYGGLVIFSGLFMASTQRLIAEAESQRDHEFDPINSSIGIYLDGLNLFLRILRILLENQKDEK